MNKEGQTGTEGQEQAGWVFKPGDAAAAPQQSQQSAQPPQQAGGAQTSAARQPAQPPETVEWTASEFIAHQKGFGWYALWFLAAIAIAGIVYLVTRDFISLAVLLFVAILFAVASAHKPRVLAYRLDQAGLTVGQRFYSYAQFKSFAVVQQGAFATVVLVPLKRFMPSIDIYIPPDNAEKIMGVLSANLPLEPREQGFVDTLAQKIRF